MLEENNNFGIFHTQFITLVAIISRGKKCALQ